MGIYLPNMEMPKDGFVEIIIKTDGTVQQTGQTLRLAGDYFYTAYVGERPPMYKAVPVPPHGRLIDVAVLWVEINKICDRRDEGIISDLTCLQQLLSAFRHAPTIIQAEPLNEEVKE